MPKYVMEYNVSSGKNPVQKKETRITRPDDESARKTYNEFCQNANNEGVGESVHPTGLYKLEEGGARVKIDA